MELKDLAKSINEKLDSVETQITEVKAKAGEQGEFTSNLKEQLTGLETKQAELLKQLETTQKSFDDFQASNKRVQGSDLKSELEANKEKLMAFKNGETSRVKFDLSSLSTKATMLHSSHTGDIVEDFRLSGVYDTPDRPQHIRQVMNTTSYSTEGIRYVTESWTDNAGTRAEGSAGSETSTALTEQTAPTKIISTYLTVSKESLADIPFLLNHLTTRGMKKIMLQEDDQVLNGSGSGNNLTGITNSATAYTDSLALSTVQRFDVLASACTQAVVNEYRPNLILVHPTDYDLIARSKDGQAGYIVPDAVLGAAPLTIYGARVMPTTAMTSGDFLVGDFNMGATLGIREDVSVTISDSHSTNFTAGLVTILIEERVALPIYRSDAFIWGDFATALAEASA